MTFVRLEVNEARGWDAASGRLCYASRVIQHFTVTRMGTSHPLPFLPRHRGLLSFHREAEGVLEVRMCSRI